MQNTLLVKSLILSIIVLFIGVGIRPAFARDTNTSIELISNDNDLVELPIQIHTSKGVERYTLELTNQQVEELDKIFDKLKDDLWEYDSHYEVTESYKVAIVSLKEKGLLPDGLSIEEAQKLVITNSINSNFGKLFSHLRSYLAPGNVFNLFCSVSGSSTNSGTASLFPNSIFKRIYYGYTRNVGHIAAEGYIHTSGLFLTQKSEGSFFGRIYSQAGTHKWHCGTIGFRGIVYSTNPLRYSGRAIWVWVGDYRWE